MSVNEHEDERQGGTMSVLHRIGSFFSLHEDEDDELYEEEAAASATSPPKRNVVAFNAREGRRAPSTEVGVYVPRTFADVTDIADALRRRQVVIVNLQGVDRGLLQRVVDFTSGVAYTLDGKIQKLAEGIYLVVPPGVAVNAAGLRDTIGDSMLDFMNERNAR